MEIFQLYRKNDQCLSVRLNCPGIISMPLLLVNTFILVCSSSARTIIQCLAPSFAFREMVNSHFWESHVIYLWATHVTSETALSFGQKIFRRNLNTIFSCNLMASWYSWITLNVAITQIYITQTIIICISRCLKKILDPIIGDIQYSDASK